MTMEVTNRRRRNNSWLAFAIVCVVFLSDFALCGAYIFFANRLCPIASEPHATSPPHSWIVRFACEAKAADVALVFFTYGLMAVTAWLAWATIKLWKAGEEQTKITREALIADQRAWITTSLVLNGDFCIGDTGASIVVALRVTNIGKTPALRATTSMKMVLTRPSLLQDEVRKVCESNRQPRDDSGRLVLQNET